MELNIVKSKKNSLLQRQELELEILGNKSTPSRKELIQKIADYTNNKPELVVIQKISPGFGTHTNKAWVRVYDSAAMLEKLELKHIVERNRGKKLKHGKQAASTEAPPAPTEPLKREESEEPAKEK